jgi:Holliday junction resolvase - archaeal type
VSASQRNKGQRGERELARLLEGELGVEVTRRLMQTRDGGHDLDGLPVALEVKRQDVPRVREWWEQTCRQAEAAKLTPVLAYRANRQCWRFVVPAALLCAPGKWEQSLPYTATLYLEGFCLLMRECFLGLSEPRTGVFSETRYLDKG